MNKLTEKIAIGIMALGITTSAMSARKTAPLTVPLTNDYEATRIAKITLDVAAGIYAGTVTVQKTQDGYMANGTYSRLQNPEALDKACRTADVDRDKIITTEEASNLLNTLYLTH